MKSVILIVVGILLFGCKKAEDRSCWKVAGKPSSKIVELEDFSTLFLGAHIEYTLIQDSMNYVEIVGAENLLNLVSTNIENDKLSIENKNKCNFLRSYKKKGIHVKIHFTSIYNIEFQGTEALRNEGILTLPYFTLTIKDGAGPVELTINSIEVYAGVSHGYGDFTLHGTTNYGNFNLNSNGYCNTRNLQINDSIDIISNTSVLTRFNVDSAQTRIEIKNKGNVEYLGIPSSLKVEQFGSGEVLDGN